MGNRDRNLFAPAVIVKGLIGFAAETARDCTLRSGRKLMRPPGELNPGGLAGRLLYGVLIAIGRKCFIAPN
jgi:hypothetical protein